MKGTMRAAVFEGEGLLSVREVPVPSLQRPEDLIIQVEACSVCGTDVHITSIPPGYAARPGTILGHELVGTVVQTGAGVTTIHSGDRVICNPNDYCGICCACRKNLPNLCEHLIPLGIEADGGFAEYVRLSERTVYRIPIQMPARLAMFAEPLACVINGFNKLHLFPSSNALVIGAGPIGLMMVQIIRAAGIRPILVSETSSLRRNFALESGAAKAVDPKAENLIQTVYEQTQGIGADVVVDVVGSQLPLALECVRKGGTVLLFGVNTAANTCVVQSRITQKEVTVQGTWLANASFPDAVRMLESGILDLEKLITHVFPLEQIVQAIEMLRSGNGVKILIDPQQKG